MCFLLKWEIFMQSFLFMFLLIFCLRPAAHIQSNIPNYILQSCCWLWCKGNFECEGRKDKLCRTAESNFYLVNISLNNLYTPSFTIMPSSLGSKGRMAFREKRIVRISKFYSCINVLRIKYDWESLQSISYSPRFLVLFNSFGARRILGFLIWLSISYRNVCIPNWYWNENLHN